MDRNNPDEVECIDFSYWLKNNFNNNDHIIVKMDIEGAEYDIIEKMLNDNTFEYINQLYIEWHNKKLNIKGIDKRHNKLINLLKDYNVNIDDTWCSINYSTTYPIWIN